MLPNGFNRQLLDQPDLKSERENSFRRSLLRTIRGYGANQLLFTGFPSDTRWRRVLLEPSDFETMRYANHRTWQAISGGTRLVLVGARTLKKNGATSDTAQIFAIANALRRGAIFLELIAAEAADRSLILIEGHSRATAYALEGKMDRVEAIVASSPSIPNWAFY